MKGGGNITDISEYEGVRLACQYWSADQSDTKLDEVKKSKLIFVGDVHGDINQFIAPLVLSGLITIVNAVNEVKSYGSKIYIPHYKINKNKTVKIVYLGDIVNEWIFNRTITYMLYDLLKNASANVYYLFGNHDLALIGRYHLFKQNKLNLSLDIPALWETAKKELNYVRDLKIYRDKAELNGDPVKGAEYVHKHLMPVFESLYSIMNEGLGKVCLPIEVNNKRYMLSHTTWSVYGLIELIKTDKPNDIDSNAGLVGKKNSKKKEDGNNEQQTQEQKQVVPPIDDEDTIAQSQIIKIKTPVLTRPSDLEPSQIEPITSNTSSKKYTAFIQTVIDKIKPFIDAQKLIPPEVHDEIDYVRLAEAVNIHFITKSRLYISKNVLTSTRTTKAVFLNHIVGHSPGDEFRDQNVNIGASTYFKERMSKLTHPAYINKRIIYYFDFGCSAGYDHDEISRPDFVFSSASGLYVSTLPGFSYIKSNGKDALLVMRDKTPRSPNKIIVD